MYRWYFVNHLANHFSHFVFRHSHQTVSIFTKCQRGDRDSFSSSFPQNQRWMKSVILWEAYSDWFAISRNSARTCRNVRNNKCIASFITISRLRFPFSSLYSVYNSIRCLGLPSDINVVLLSRWVIPRFLEIRVRKIKNFSYW